MYYYEVAVPIKIRQSLVYKSPIKLNLGIRVIVSVGRNLYTSIVLKRVSEQSLNSKIRYKTIIEVIDKEAILSKEMLCLAEWMSDYYKTTIGIVVDTMLPLALKHHITQKIKLRDNKCIIDFDEIADSIVKILQDKPDEWVNVQALREMVKSINFYHTIEILEKENIIEVFRSFDEKVKPKYANYIRRLESFLSANCKLTDKQSKAWDLICDKPDVFPLSEVVPDISYAIIKALKSKKLIEVFPRKVDIDLFKFPEKQEVKQISLNVEQISAIDKVNKAIDLQKYKTFLLFGITGSGKTEVYIDAIKHCQSIGKSALMLVPEISLTPQTVFRFFHVFGKNIAVLHSNLSDRERYMQWKLIAQGKINIVIGARSAIFAPLKNTGLIIVDEEHESSYKQEHQPCYNGRDLAVKRGEIEKAVVILGSATPSLESWNNTLVNKYELIKLTLRPGAAILPEVKIIDLKEESDNQSLFSEELKTQINNRLEKNEQIILFHNRRGYSNFLQCTNCGKVFRCPDCDISLKLHKSDHLLVCHYCGFNEPIPRKCPDCSSYHFNYGAPGTEQIDSQLRILFPTARILRMDSDTTKKKDSFSEMFDAMRNHHIDILIGTQMISKGLDFHNVTLVGVILAEVTLNIPDFRSTERTFQLLTQVAGRSGRGDKKGEVIIQTRNPEHYALTYAAKQDFLSFAEKELQLRSEVFYPPTYRICRILFSCPDLDFLKATLSANHTLLIKLKLLFPENEFYLLPFIEAPLPKIKTKYRYHLIVKSLKPTHIQSFLNQFIDEFICPPKISMTIDNDPLSLL